jgi:hypothetical protein
LFQDPSLVLRVRKVAYAQSRNGRQPSYRQRFLVLLQRHGEVRTNDLLKRGSFHKCPHLSLLLSLLLLLSTALLLPIQVPEASLGMTELKAKIPSV